MIFGDRGFRARMGRRLGWTEILESRTFLSAAYTLQDLGTLPGGTYSVATAINDAGQVVGNGDSHAFLWTAGGGMVDLGTPGDLSQATGINNSGEITGFDSLDNGNYAAVIWHANGSAPEQNLGTLSGDDASMALGINNIGEVVGTSGLSFEQAITWTAAGGMQLDNPIPAGTRNQDIAINNEGQIAANAYADGGNSTAFVLTPNGICTPLGSLQPGATSDAMAINDSEQVVGFSDTGHAFIWSPGGGMKDLGLLPGTTTSEAMGINNAGEVVGSCTTNPSFAFSGSTVKYSSQSISQAIPAMTYTAYVWTAGGGMQNLNDLIPANSGLTLDAANAVNNKGQIVGWGLDGSGQTHAFLLTPVTHLAFIQEPPSVAYNGSIAGPITVAIEDQNNQIITTDDSNVTLSIASGPGAALSGTFSAGGPSTSTTVAAVNGIATFSELDLTGAPSALVFPTGANAGTFALAATDGNDAPAISTPILNPAISQMTLTTSNTAPNVGQSVTFTGTISGGGYALVPTGTVTFTAGNVVLGTASANNVGPSASFSFTTSSLPAGSYMITATYGGDAAFTGSTSTVTEIVTAASPLKGTLMVKSPAAVFAGQKIPGKGVDRFVPAVFTLMNTGNTPIHGKVGESFYISTTGALDSGAVQLPVLRDGTLRLPPGEQMTRHVKLYIPANATPGISTVFMQIHDPNGAATLVADPDAVTVLQNYAHLSGVFSRTPIAAKAGATAGATIVVTNTGNAAAVGMVTIDVQASATGVFDGTAPFALTTMEKIDIKPGESETIRLKGVTLPATAGKYFLVAELLADRQIPEVDMNMNTLVSVQPVNVT